MSARRNISLHAPQAIANGGLGFVGDLRIGRRGRFDEQRKGWMWHAGQLTDRRRGRLLVAMRDLVGKMGDHICSLKRHQFGREQQQGRDN
jgi:hypothetical protein